MPTFYSIIKLNLFAPFAIFSGVIFQNGVYQNLASIFLRKKRMQNVDDILQAAFGQIPFTKKITNSNCKQINAL